MDEKIIEAKFKRNYLAWALLIVGVVFTIISLCFWVNEYFTREMDWTYYGTTKMVSEFYDFFEYPEYAFNRFFQHPYLAFDYGFAPMILLSGLAFLVSIFFFLQRGRGKLIVTNKRVTGKASFGKVVDLPLDQISAVALGSFSSITVATSSGRVHFWSISNREEIHSTLIDSIGKVQRESSAQQVPSTPIVSNADELQKYKELLDSGIITQEEFDTKKKQLLGL